MGTLIPAFLSHFVCEEQISKEWEILYKTKYSPFPIKEYCGQCQVRSWVTTESVINRLDSLNSEMVPGSSVGSSWFVLQVHFHPPPAALPPETEFKDMYFLGSFAL